MALGISLSYSRNDLPALVSEQGVSNTRSPAEIEELWKRHQHFPQKLFIHYYCCQGLFREQSDHGAQTDLGEEGQCGQCLQSTGAL